MTESYLAIKVQELNQKIIEHELKFSFLLATLDNTLDVIETMSANEKSIVTAIGDIIAELRRNSEK